MSDKEELEKQKLQAEIDEIRQKIEAEKQRLASEKKIFSKSNLGSWSAIMISLITIITGGSSIGVRVYKYLAQTEEAQKVSVDRAMIEIVKELNSDDPIKRKNNILLLASYEMQAVPILLGNLEFSKKPQPLIESLKLIINKNKSTAKEVLSSLEEKARDVFRWEIKNLKPSDDADDTAISMHADDAISNYIFALKELDKENAKSLFEAWKQELNKEDSIAASLKKNLIECMN